MQNQTKIYLDNAATTPVREEVRADMEPYWAHIYGNPSGHYAVSRMARSAVDEARVQVAALIGAQPDEVVFTSGGTESDNWALLGVALANMERRGHVLVSAVEHHAVLEPAALLRELGFEVEQIPVDRDGLISVDDLRRRLRPDTLLVSVMAVNNEVGALQPVEQVGALCRARNIVFHCDAVQAAGKLGVDVVALGADLLSLSAHKFGGPKGVGALFIRRGVAMRAMSRGGAQERGRRAGTENVPAIVGMGTAARLALRDLSANAALLETLRRRLEAGLCQLPGLAINACGVARAPHITNVMIGGLRAESLAVGLDLRGIAVGTGSACASGAIEASHVLVAMGRSREEAKGAVRISLGVQNTAEEVDATIGAFAELARRMVETYWAGGSVEAAVQPEREQASEVQVRAAVPRAARDEVEINA